ncbi:hypothetical protein Rhopal_000001-T1, partial [Rhodotorula paludigena]
MQSQQVPTTPPGALLYETGPLKEHGMVWHAAASCLICHRCAVVVPITRLDSHVRQSPHTPTRRLSPEALAHAHFLAASAPAGRCCAFDLAALDPSSPLLPLPHVKIVRAKRCLDPTCKRVWRQNSPCPACQRGGASSEPCEAQGVPSDSGSPVLVAVPPQPVDPPPAASNDSAIQRHVDAARVAAATLALAPAARVVGHIAPVTVPPFQHLRSDDFVANQPRRIRWLVRPPPDSAAHEWFLTLRDVARQAFTSLDGFVGRLPPAARDKLMHYDREFDSTKSLPRWRSLAKTSSCEHYADVAAELVHFVTRLACDQHGASPRLSVPLPNALRPAVQDVVAALGSPPPLPDGPSLARLDTSLALQAHTDREDLDDDESDVQASAASNDELSDNETDSPMRVSLEDAPPSSVEAVTRVLEALFSTAVTADFAPVPYSESTPQDVVPAFAIISQLSPPSSTSEASQTTVFKPLGRATPLIAKLKYIARLATASAVRRLLQFEGLPTADKTLAFVDAIKAAASVLLSHAQPGPFHTITHWSRFLTACLLHELPLPRFSSLDGDPLHVFFEGCELKFRVAASRALEQAHDLAATSLPALLRGFSLEGRLPAVQDMIDDPARSTPGFSAAAAHEGISRVVDAAFAHILSHDLVIATAVGDDTGAPIDVARVDAFLADVDRLTAQLMPLAYLSAAGAYRLPEFLSVSLVNLASTHRGVVYRGGRLQLVPWYNKNLAKASRGSPIPRPLPPFLADVIHAFVCVVKPLAARVASLGSSQHPDQSPRRTALELLAQAHAQMLWVTPLSAAPTPLRSPVDVERSRNLLSRGLGSLFGCAAVSTPVLRQCTVGVLRYTLEHRAAALQDALRLLHLPSEDGEAPLQPDSARLRTLVVDQMAGHSTGVATQHYAVEEDRLYTTLFKGHPQTLTASDWDKIQTITDVFHCALGWPPLRNQPSASLPSTVSSSPLAPPVQPSAASVLEALGTDLRDLLAVLTQGLAAQASDAARVERKVEAIVQRLPNPVGAPLDAHSDLEVPIPLIVPPAVDALAPLSFLQAVHGPAAHWRTPAQANLVPLLCSDVPSGATLAPVVRALVEPTGAGKTNAVLIPALVRPQRLTLFVVGTVALRSSVTQALQAAAARVPTVASPTSFVSAFSSDMLSSRCGIVLVSPEHAFTRAFQEWVARVGGRAQRSGDVHLVIDEPQLLYAHDSFREQVALLRSTLGNLGVPTTFLSATVPPSLEHDLFSWCRGPRPVEVFRTATTRLNLHVVVLPPSVATNIDSRARLVATVADIAFAAPLSPNARGIVYLRSRNDVQAVAAAHAAIAHARGDSRPVSIYHGALDDTARERSELSWFSGDASPIMFCTPQAFGTGVDRPN